MRRDDAPAFAQPVEAPKNAPLLSTADSQATRDAAETFDYHEAFSRSVGWITREELDILRTKRIAIAGVGGVGGSHATTLARLGIGHFHLSDLDNFELANFNRQRGANVNTIGKPKADVIAANVTAINPTATIKVFGSGIDRDNVDAFLRGVDLYVDGLDFFAVDARRLVFERCAELGIPAVTAAPLGMGAALLTFMPGGMTFEEYFRLEGRDRQEQLIRFLVGLSPAMLQRPYLADASTVNLSERRGPSTPMACDLCAGFAATEALKILLGRGNLITAPRALQYDAYRNKVTQTWRPWGNANPIQRVALTIARRVISKAESMYSSSTDVAAAPAKSRALSKIEQIINLARWAPSGDNIQPWRFEITGQNDFTIHSEQRRDLRIYDVCGQAQQTSIGVLMETIDIAASRFGCRCQYERVTGSDDAWPAYHVKLRDDFILEDPLCEFIERRVTDRRPFTTRALSDRAKAELRDCLSPHYEVRWFESLLDRHRIAALNFAFAHIRLTSKQAYLVHCEIIDWSKRFSDDRIPDEALGIHRLSRRLMRWGMKSWQRVNLLNHIAMAHVTPRLQMEYLPGLCCGAHAAIIAKRPAQTIDDFIAAGRTLQRFWLTATRFGIRMQPGMTPVMFSAYVRNGVRFVESNRAWQRAQRLTRRLDRIIGGDDVGSRVVAMARLGYGPQPASRSVRLPMEQLITHEEDAQAA